MTLPEELRQASRYTALDHHRDLLERAAAEIERLESSDDELRFLNEDLLYWVDRAVDKGNANSDIEEATARYYEWLKGRAALSTQGEKT